MKKYKKYMSTNSQKECPFGTLHQKQCANCRFALERLSNREIELERNNGNMEAHQEQYSCIVIAIFQELLKLNKEKSEK